MTEGVSIGNMAIKPQTLYKAGMAAASAAGGAAGGDKASAGGGGASDKMSTGGGGASDKMSTGGGGASDKMSTGGGGGGKEKMAAKIGQKIQGMGSSAASSLTSGFDVSKASSTSVKGEESGDGGSKGKMPVPQAKSSGSDEGGG